MTKTMKPKAVLSSEDILAAPDVQYVDLAIPEWGGTLRIRSLTAEEAEQFVTVNLENKKEGILNIFFMSVVNEEGKLLFKGTPEERERLRKKAWKVLVRVQNAAIKLNGMSDEEKQAAKND